MSAHDDELLAVALSLLRRRSGQRGRLPGARVRRSISTSYYAIFHFLLDEVGRRVIGSTNKLRVRRRLVARSITHAGAKTALDKVRGRYVHAYVSAFLGGGEADGPIATPPFVRNLAAAFIDAQAKRLDADYDLNELLSAADARVLRGRVRRAIKAWRAATTPADRDFKHALCVLVLLKGQIQPGK